MKSMMAALIGLVLLCIGCSKENSFEGKPDESFFLRYSLDGQAVAYNQDVFATKARENALETLTIQGSATTGDNQTGLLMVLAQATAFTAQTYPELPGNDTPAILYRDTAGVEFSNVFMTEPSGLEIVITEINEDTVRGTFRGNVADLDGNLHAITDGAFFVPVQ